MNSTVPSVSPAGGPLRFALPVVGALAIVAAGLALPQWQFLLSISLSKGIVALGLALLLRAGLASFGQALFYSVGAYTVGMATSFLHISDITLLLLVATVIPAVLAGVLGFLLSRYRDIFFAMLTLALSMIVYGLVLNNSDLGGSDGFNVGAASFGGSLVPAISKTALFAVVFLSSVLSALLVHWYMGSKAGRLAPAIKDNEIRVEYLGSSARANIHLTYVIAGALAGLGGALTAFNVGHIDPDMAFWTTSGEFIFIAVLSGTGRAYAPFVGALLLEIARATASVYAPNTWQIVIGIIMLAIIAFLPGGLTSLKLPGRAPAASTGGKP